MKKSIALLLALVMTLGLLAGCDPTPASTTAPPSIGTTTPGSLTTAPPATTQPVPAANEITDYITYWLVANEMETWNSHFSQNQKELDFICNMVEGLLTNNNYGQLIPAVAETWSTNDGGVTWTFNLRKDSVWVDQKGKVMAENIAEDWLWGLEWVLNFWKNDSNNTSMPREMIKGATEYYEYTKALDEAAGKALGLDKFLEMVGIEAPDNYTVVYTCVAPLPYFETLTCYNCLLPVSGKLLESIGVDGYKAVTPATLWYNGLYTCTTYVQNNEKVFTKNPEYWDKQSKRFNTVTVKMVESTDIAYQMYQNGELDYVALTESTLQTIYNNPSHQFNEYLVEGRPSKYSISLHPSFYKNKEDGTPDVNWNTAMANEAFRLTWYYGLDTSTYLRRINAINPIKCANYAYTMRNLSFTSAGKDYVDLVLDRLGVTPDPNAIARLDKAKFDQYKAQAIEELTAKGVTFPIVCDYYIPASNQTSLDSATVLKQTFADSFGEDFCVLNIKTYISSVANEVRTPKLGGLYITGWGADYGDPLNFLSQEIYGSDNAYFAIQMSNINLATDPDLIADYQTFTDMVLAADKIVDDKDARYNAFADAEAYMISKAFAIPIYYNIAWQLTHVNDFTKVYALYGNQSNRWVNWETSKDSAYTTEDYKNFEAIYESGKK